MVSAEEAFASLCYQMMFPEYVENGSQMLIMFCKCMAVNQDVVKEY